MRSVSISSLSFWDTTLSAKAFLRNFPSIGNFYNPELLLCRCCSKFCLGKWDSISRNFSWPGETKKLFSIVLFKSFLNKIGICSFAIFSISSISLLFKFWKINVFWKSENIKWQKYFLHSRWFLRIVHDNLLMKGQVRDQMYFVLCTYCETKQMIQPNGIIGNWFDLIQSQFQYSHDLCNELYQELKILKNIDSSATMRSFFSSVIMLWERKTT